MTDPAEQRLLMRLLAAALTVLWAGIGVAIASAYRPGGPVDIVVALACFLPVVVADAGVVWPPLGTTRASRMALVWAWVAALLLAVPILYDVAIGLAGQGPQSLLPSFETAYGGALALFSMAWFSVVGLVHRRRGEQPLEWRSGWLAAGAAALLTLALGLGFVFVTVVNDQAHRRTDPATSRFGPTDPEVIPPFCDQMPRLGQHASVHIEARSRLDEEDRGHATIDGRRSDLDEAWGGSWSGPDGQGQQAYRRVGAQAWLQEGSDDPEAPGSTWREVPPDPFGLLGDEELTLDGPAYDMVAVPRGEIVAEDLGLEIIQGARARHCRTFIDGPTALDTFLPLRWLLTGVSAQPDDAIITRWRGELDWWVFGDGEMGMASLEVSGPKAETEWQAEGVRAVLEARLEAIDRTRDLDISGPTSASSPGVPPSAALESAAP